VRALHWLLWSVVLSLSCGCATAYGTSVAPSGLFTYTTRPLALNLHGTPSDHDMSQASVKTIQYSGYRIDWGDNGIGSLAKEHGFEAVYYADIKTLSILGIWTQNWVQIHGKLSAEGAGSTLGTTEP